MSENIPSTLRVKVITPQKLLFDEEVQEVFLPGMDGYLGILPGHRPLITALGEGKITCRRRRGEEQFVIHGGYARVMPGQVLVFTELGRGESDKESDNNVEG